MRKSEQIQKTELVIQGFLALLGKRVSRTQIVKFVYLADNSFYESTGRTITGTQYIWDHYGPNSMNNIIAGTTDKLVGEGRVSRAVGAYNGGHTFNYWVNDPHAAWRHAASVLSDGECQIVRDIARKYGRYNASDLASLSKKTKPFENAKQYEILRFKQNKRAKELQQWLDSIEGLNEEVEAGLADADAGRWVWADEVEEQTSCQRLV